MFKNRSSQLELLDSDEIEAQDLFQNLKELDTINHLLGGYKITYNALEKTLKPKHNYNLIDIGCGGGDTLKRIATWAKNKPFQLSLYGIDIKPVCINYAQTNNPNSSIHFITDGYKNMHQHIASIDIIHACLFCHHLNQQQLIELIQFALLHKAILIINDLERNALAYYLIKGLTRLFSKSYLVKNDAPLSVARGFKKVEWLAIIKMAGAKHYTVKNKWAFRHQIIINGAK
jgi:2-polyprenyl-3-methyl-5-hydroxy-6-metoxy-1,4-benzoquinol methylase